MSKLFASHLLQTTLPSSPIKGHYDPEQELWVGDNQLRGRVPTYRQTWCDWWGWSNFWVGCEYISNWDHFEEWDDDEDM